MDRIRRKAPGPHGHEELSMPAPSCISTPLSSKSDSCAWLDFPSDSLRFPGGVDRGLAFLVMLLQEPWEMDWGYVIGSRTGMVKRGILDSYCDHAY